MRTTYDQEVDSRDYRDENRNRNMDQRGMGRQTYREQPYNEPIHPPEPHDLTLGMTALAGIFLAVVLVCAVFFGFGYSTGRTLHGSKPAVPQGTASAVASASAPANTVADDASAATSTPPLTASQPAGKPSAGAPASDADPEAAPRGEAGAPSAQTQTVDEPAGFPPSASRTAPATRTPPASASVNAPPSVLPAATGGVMVQIAAVMRQTDADMLAHALRTNGYSAVVRSEPQDKFLHVQIGPFATRDQAKAMRARLLGDGYNAFLKP